jgi:hypothetical protein
LGDFELGSDHVTSEKLGHSYRYMHPPRRKTRASRAAGPELEGINNGQKIGTLDALSEDQIIMLQRLTFVADLGVKAGDPGVDEIIHKVLGMQSRAGAS